eukprot:2080544-Alexandrium_andersonii.AAC.1
MAPRGPGQHALPGFRKRHRHRPGTGLHPRNLRRRPPPGARRCPRSTPTLVSHPRSIFGKRHNCIFSNV